MSDAIKDEVFGEIKNFETEVEWLGRKISVSFDGGIESDWSEEKKVEEIKRVIEQFKIMYLNQEEWDKKMKDLVSDYGKDGVMDWLCVDDEEELEEFIENIHENSEIELSEEEIEELKREIVPERVFRNCIYLQGLWVTADGDFTAFYYDNDIFFLGHAIMLSGNINGELGCDGEVG